MIDLVDGDGVAIVCHRSQMKAYVVSYSRYLRVDRVFFFSSRRRHTRCSRDWSSDVCSSDLCAQSRRAAAEFTTGAAGQRLIRARAHAPGRWNGAGAATPAQTFVLQAPTILARSEEHTSELQSRLHLVCRLLLEKKKNNPSRTAVRAQGKLVSLATSRIQAALPLDPMRPTSPSPYTTARSRLQASTSARCTTRTG